MAKYSPAELNEFGKVIHEPWAEDGERLDDYLARVLPDVGDLEFWYQKCDENRVQVRDNWDIETMTFSQRKGWYLQWWDGERWNRLDLQKGERPRMRNGYCHIVKET